MAVFEVISEKKKPENLQLKQIYVQCQLTAET